MFPRSSFTRLMAVGAVGAVGGLIAIAPGGAAQAQAQGHGVPYHLAKTIHVPVPEDALTNGWCYDTAIPDPDTGMFYLADGANRQITVINPRTGNTRGIGTGLFTGIAGCRQFDYDGQGPNGQALYGGRWIFAGNGDSRVLGFDLKTGRQVASINTGGKFRADEMTVVPGARLAVANPAEKPSPWLSFINLKTYHVDAKFVFTHATGGLEQPQFWRGHLYVSVPTTTENPAGGEVAELDISNLAHITIVHRFAFATCQPAGLDIRADGVAAVGCGGPKATDQEILNLRTGQETPVRGVPAVDIVAVFRSDFFYVSYGLPAFVIANRQGTILQRFPATGASHTIAINPANGDALVPLDKGDVAVYKPGSAGLWRGSEAREVTPGSGVG